MTFANSREAAEAHCGVEAVEAYGRVKTFYGRFGKALERSFAQAVGGRVGGRGESDVITELGTWEFATQQNTKNGHGNTADLSRVDERHTVQVFGRPNKGWISGAEFLALHGVADPETVAAYCVEKAYREVRVMGEQLPLAPVRVLGWRIW